MQKVGRNDPCPCGSGKKHKQCCQLNEPARLPFEEIVAETEINEFASLFHAQRYADMETRAQLLVKKYPHSGFAWKALGAALHEQGRNALPTLQKAIELLPGDAEVWNMLGNALQAQDRIDEALEKYRQALAINPIFPEALNNQGMLLLKQGNLEEAVTSLRKASEIQPDIPQAHYNLGNALQKLEQGDAAAASFRQAIALNPNLAEAHHNLATILENQGHLEEAALEFDRAIQIKPDLIDAHYGLSSLKTYRATDPHAAMLDQQRDQIAMLPLETQIRYWFTQGKVREDMGCYDASFAAYQTGNQLQKVVLDWDEALENAWAENILTFFSKEFFATRPLPQSTEKNKTPIFIVGMPRSGTSLLEQILATYPGTFGAGELNDLAEVVQTAMPDGRLRNFPRGTLSLSAMDLLKMGEQYIDRLWQHAPDALRITDKMPANFFYIGLIHLMLPGVKIIHAMRDPMDSCFSCYSRLFNTNLLKYTYDLQTLGRYYQRYNKLMQHWHAVLPAGTILDVHYEEMVDDIENQARRLLDYLDLPWNDQCLAFYENKRQVKTASLAQVRKPIYKTSVARWKHFEKHLSPLMNLVQEHRQLPSTGELSQHQLAMEHQMAGRLEQAQFVYRQILQVAPQDSQALHQLGLIAYRMGDTADAIDLIRQAINANPGNPDAHNDLGGLLNLQGKLDEAVACFQRTLHIAPNHAKTHYNLACTLQAQGKLTEAEASYRQVLAITPDAIGTLCNLGSCLQELGRADEAILCYQQALALNPDDIKSINNLGVSLQTNGRLHESIASFERTIAAYPEYAKTYVNLGMSYYDLGEMEKALACYLKSIALDSEYAEGHFCVGVVLQTMCKPTEALAAYRRALAIKSDDPQTHNNVLMAMQFVPGTTAEELFIAHAKFGERFEKALKPLWQAHENLRDPGKRLKVGYISGDFRTHAVAYFIEPVFANHDKSQVEIFCYSNSLRRDAFTERLISETDHWQPCFSMSDEELAARIRADGIDILVDLSGHTAHNRLLTFARKPAPIQITYLGYPGSSGLSAMDYRITDHFTEPGNDQYYTEKLLRLPDSMWCYRPGQDMPEVTPLPALTNGYLTFGSFNNINKIGDECIELWATLLHTLPTARLMLVTITAEEIKQKLLDQFHQLGISSERLSFYGKLPPQEFQRLLQQVDITLDPFPINGATTTCESLWLGVPVMAMVGARFHSRAGLSVLRAAQLPDFVMETQEQFLQMATLLGNNLPLLANIRAGLREHLQTTALFDQLRFTRNMENIYRKIWEKWCAGDATTS